MVNRLELLRDGEDGLNVVVAQLLNQVSNGGIILRNGKREMCSVTTVRATKCNLNETSNTDQITLSYLHSSGSLYTHCSPSGIFHRLAERCRPACRHQQSESQHQWRTPADESHSSNQFAPERRRSKTSKQRRSKTATFALLKAEGEFEQNVTHSLFITASQKSPY